MTLKAMLLTKLKVTAAFLIVVGLVAVGGGSLVHGVLAGTPTDRPVAMAELPARLPEVDQGPTEEQARGAREQPKDGAAGSGTLQAVDADRNRVTLSISSRQTSTSEERTLEVARDAKILRDGKEIKLADLKTGGRVTLRLSPDKKTVVSLSVVGAMF